MRRRKADLARRVNGSLALRYTADGLTSYSGLELVRQFLVQSGFSGDLRRQLRECDPAGDYSSLSLIRLVIAMLLVGASRLRHVQYLGSDPIVERFCGLSVLPSARTLSRWLSRCTANVREALLALNQELIARVLWPLQLRRLTLDVDGTVICTGLQVERAKRGYNPHHRKVPSYYPITAHLAQTGHVLRVQNRSGNVHDGKASMGFLRDLFAQAREMVPGALLEIRMDGAFFRKETLTWLNRRAEYAVRVPFYQWVDLQSHIRRRRRWRKIRPGLDGFEIRLWVDSWGKEYRVAIYRKKVFHKTKKNYQLDLFDPSDGTWEYSAIVTNKKVGLKALWYFMAGRGSHEKVLAELKNGYAFDTVPTQKYAANGTWQILAMLTYNLTVNLQIALGARRRKMNAKRSPLFELKSIRTLRYELLSRAGILQYPAGRATLTLSKNLPTRRLFETMVEKLKKAA